MGGTHYENYFVKNLRIAEKSTNRPCFYLKIEQSMPNLYNSQFKNMIKIPFIRSLNGDSNTEEEMLVVDENLGVRT